MNFPEKRFFSQPALLVFLSIFGLLSLSTFVHLYDKMPYQWWRVNLKKASSFPWIGHPSFLSTPSNSSSLLCNTTHNSCSSSSKIINSGIWTVNSIGRLGNQMGQYATLYALAKINGHQAYILPATHQYLSPIFQITLPMIHAEVAKKIHWKNFQLHNWMSEDYNHIQGKYVQLTGFPWSYTFYHHIRQEILQEFSFHDHIKEEANQYLQELRGKRQEVTYVGVHVRRGDYVRIIPPRKAVLADRGYLEKAMNYFRKKYLNPIFVVASNGMEWCKQNINASKGDVYFAGDGRESSPVKDFALLAHCNHTIMTLGSFGIWASYLAGGETVYLANHTLPDSPMLRIFKASAVYLPEWIGIPADLSPLLSKQPAEVQKP
ncbi:galactoside alpha-(1,2)-fucosyltransferase 2-like [Rhineura floridana]|uniref:galactoside alpha-(1,2)-fucosyltransferase 2-like n=1 Tax=Rhineura floridana TaxID=261503 RepID=UPI002AC7F18D|nr:galactoside alpha-(1,2)-fucosyltransferase 2-like [Rhineura floridana]